MPNNCNLWYVRYTEHFIDTGNVNLALNKPATQSSEYKNGQYPARRAVNGGLEDFSHTAEGETGTKWWKVDLQAAYNIRKILLYNRAQGK